MTERTIFSEKYDYLIPVAASAVALWLFYGAVVAIGGAVVLLAIANLQPVRRLGVPQTSSALLGAALLLILSIYLKLYDRDAYCYALLGPEREVLDNLRVALPCFGGGFYQNIGQPGGMGYVRDVGLPLAGVILGLFALRKLRARETDRPSDRSLMVVGIAFMLLMLVPPVVQVVSPPPADAQSAEQPEPELEHAVSAIRER